MWQSCTCLLAGSLCRLMKKWRIESSSKLSSYLIIIVLWITFRAGLQLMYNFQNFLLVHSKYRVVLVCEYMIFLLSVYFFINDAVVDFDSEKNRWLSIGLLLSCIESQRFWSSCVVVESESETCLRAFCVLEHFELLISFCLVISCFFLVFFQSDLSYILFMPCNYKIVSFFFDQTIINNYFCLFPKLSLDISIRVVRSKSKG